jgi:hypothetical protein
MDGRDRAEPFDALLRQLRRLRPPIASVVFRQRAWRDFERALDPLGVPRDRPRASREGLHPSTTEGASARDAD